MDARSVVHALKLKYGSAEKDMNVEENALFDHIVGIIENRLEIIEEVKTLGFGGDDGSDMEMNFGDEDDSDTEIEEEEEEEGLVATTPEVLHSSQASTSDSDYEGSPVKKRNILDDDYKEAAWKFLTENDDGTLRNVNRKASTVMNRFRRIKNMNILYKYGKSRDKPTMKKVNDAVLNIFREKVQECAVIHDRNLRLWALQIKENMDPQHLHLNNFKASASWVLRFKKKNNIVSRAITLKVRKNWKENERETHQLANDFVISVKSLIQHEGLDAKNIFNTDQSRFEKELHSYRTLRQVGTKRVQTVVGSQSATTHSYMIMPVISMDGEIMRPMYVLVAEPNGKFPNSKEHDPPNIVSFAGRTANMNKEDLKRFYNEAFWKSIPSDRDKILLLLDSWRANRDDSLSSGTCPIGRHLIKQLIPGGCTGLIQPLDVYFFRPYKAFIRYITDTLIANSAIQLWQRKNFLQMQGFAIYQFSAPRFRSMIKYAFYKSGYLDEEPEPWISPMDFCFDANMFDKCLKCNEMSFVKCAHCEKSLCALHAFVNEIHLDCTSA